MPQRVYYQRFYCISYIEELALVMKKRKEKNTSSPVNKDALWDLQMSLTSQHEFDKYCRSQWVFEVLDLW